MSEKQLLPGLELYNQVRAGFVLQNSTLGKWCKQNKVDQANAKYCLCGSWDGPNAKILRERLIKESNIEHLISKAA